MNIPRIFVSFFFLASIFSATATAPADVIGLSRKVNRHFIDKYPDPTVPTNVGRIRPSNLWTRGVYFEGLSALNDRDRDPADIAYIDRWADFHKWTPRNGTGTTHADDQCCEQTYLWRYRQSGDTTMLAPTRRNMDRQIATGRHDWWWWIDAIQMAMPAYVEMTSVTGDRKYLDYAMKLYTCTRDTIGGGLFNTADGLWWRDKKYVAPFTESDGKPCYWSRGNGWVYAAYARCLEKMKPEDEAYRQLKSDYLSMTDALMKCQREDGFWNASLVSQDYAGKEVTGTALFLYGLAWGLNHGLISGKEYEQACDRAWTALAESVHDDGFLGYVQGTGAAPSDAQPVTFDREPDFDDFGTGCFLLGAMEYHDLLKKRD